MLINKRITFPTYMLAMRPQTRSGLVVKRKRTRTDAPHHEAREHDGRRRGTRHAESEQRSETLIEAALLADSGAATPAMSPFPKVSGCFDAFFSAM